MHTLQVTMLLVSSAAFTAAAVIHVQPGAGTLQAALNAANAGDELVLADGTYTSGNVVGGSVGDISKSITIRAQNPRGAILDGQNVYRGLDITSGTVVLDGLDITRGRNGVNIHTRGSVTFDNCNIYSNAASVSCPGTTHCKAGGVGVSSGTVSFINCQFSSNNARYGPAIYFWCSCAVCSFRTSGLTAQSVRLKNTLSNIPHAIRKCKRRAEL